MIAQNTSTPSVQAGRGRSKPVLAIVALLLVLAAGTLLAFSFRVVSVSGPGEVFVLKANQTRLGTLVIDENAAAIFREKSHWIGPIISKKGSLTVEDDVTLAGPVILFSNSLRLGENATVQGSAYLFSGDLALGPGASVRGSTVLFAGGLRLEPGASVRRNAVLFAGDLSLGQAASVRGDVIAFAGRVQLQEESTLRGNAVLFAGGLELAPKANLQADAVLFAGDVGLRPEARVRGDVIVTAGNATLEGQSAISGRLYLNPAPTVKRGQLDRSPEAQVSDGVVRPENIETVVGLRVASMAVGYLLRLILLPVTVIIALMALMFFLGLRARPLQRRREAQALAPQPRTSGS